MAIETTDQISPGLVPLGTADRDLETVIELNAEQFTLLYPRLKYYSMSRNSTAVDTLYNEAIAKNFTDYVELPIFLVMSPQLKLLKKYGIEEEQEAIAVLNVRLSNANDIDPMTGDLIEFLGIRFEILNVKLTDYFANTQVPLNKVATLRQINAR